MLPRSDLWNAWATRRDSRAFEALLLPELPHALRFARRLGCDPAEAEDALQDALARLASIRQPFAVDGLRTWLCREVHTRARSRLRSERRRGRRQAMAAAPAESARTDTLIDDRDEVERLLDALPADERMAVELRYLHDLDYREMALVLRVSEGACRQRVSRALATLRERIGRSAPALIAALPLEPARQGPALIHAALAETATVPLAAGGGMLVATTNSKLTVAALALAAGIAGTLGVQSGLDGSPRAGARTSASGPESRLLAERDREIADLRQQLTEAIRKPPGPPPSEKADGARTTAEPGDYAAVGDRWRKEILQLEDPARQAAAWAEVRAALRSDDPTTLCAGLWAVKFTSHCVYLDRTGLDAELVALLSGTAPLPRLLAWQALLQRDQVASASGGAPVLDAALREQLRRETAASPVAVRASMVQTLIGAHGGDVAGAAAETVLRLLADEQHRAETIRGLAGARTLSDPVGRKLLDLAAESPELAAQVNRFVFGGLADKNREIVGFLLDAADRGDSEALKALHRGVRAEDASYVGKRLQRLFDAREGLDLRTRIVAAIGHAGDLSSRDWLVRLAEDEHIDSGLRFAAEVAVRNLDRGNR